MWFLSRFQHSDCGMPSRDRGKSLNLYLYNDYLQEITVVCIIQTFTLTSRYLHLPLGGQLISSNSLEMCRNRRLIGGSLFAMGCDPCQWKRGSWLLSQYFVAALRRQYTALASISLSQKVKMAWLNQSAGSAKP